MRPQAEPAPRLAALIPPHAKVGNTTKAPVTQGETTSREGVDSDVSDSIIRVCRSHPEPELWTSDSVTDQLAAAEKCFDCPLMIQCAKDGAGEAYGVYGGVTEWERPDAKKAEEQRLKDAAAIERRALEDKVDALMTEGHTKKEVAVILRMGTATVMRYREAYTKRARAAAARLADAA